MSIHLRPRDSEQAHHVVIVMIGALAFFEPAERIFLVLEGESSANHFRHAFDVVPTVGNNVKCDTEVGGFANRAVGAPVPAAEIAGLRVLPDIVLVIEQRLSQVRIEVIHTSDVADNKALDGGDGDVEFEAIVEAGFGDVGDEQ